MIHIEPKSVPFALSLLPFLGFGLVLPVTLQDWVHGRLMRGDGTTFLAGIVIVGAWEWAILWSVRSKRQQGQSRLLGRELTSWLWAPPLAFVAGLVCGLLAFSS
jgi:hypothetical protein